jgi:hypothetical protein
MNDEVLDTMREKIVSSVTKAYIASEEGKKDVALDHVENAQQMLTAMRYRIWNKFHISGVRG